MKLVLLLTLTLALFATAQANPVQDLDKQVEHGYADSNGVKIHYAALGAKDAPLIVMIHGFPDFWYSWREQMVPLSKTHRVVAIDQRGYNLSDKPKGIESYDMRLLAADVAAVIKHHGRQKAIVVGHDWGGAVAWTVAMYMPQMVEKLIILNLPHMKGLTRELANNPAQAKASQYARNFQMPDAHTKVSAAALTFWVKDPEAKKKYLEAFERSDLEAMLNYYKANYPREPYQENKADVPKVQCSVLMIHGLGDTALLPGALNNTWEWMGSDLTLVTIPGAGHFVQQDAAEFVTKNIKMWLTR
ncbi:MAG: alpha/beta hydrolase [Acidobacteria bacterium]|nr:alpha/beta hydrolase [Acidobacteriota bacterium]